MCLSAKEFGNVLLKQTRKEGERVSERFLRGSGSPALDMGNFFFFPNPHVCMRACEEPHLRRERSLLLLLNEGKMEIYGSTRRERGGCA